MQKPNYPPIETLKNLAERVLEAARHQGASGAEVGASIERGLSVAGRLGEVETIEHHLSQGLGLTVYMGQRKGSASTSDLSDKAIAETVLAAVEIARHAAEDPNAGLPDPALLARDPEDLDLYHPWSITPEEAIQVALEAESAARSMSPEITNSEGANLSTFEGFRVLGNSLGFLHGYPSTRHSLSVSVIGEREGLMQRDDWWTVARSSLTLESPESVGRKAAERTLRRLGSRTLSTRKCPVLFAPEMASGLLGHFIGAIRGGNLYRKSSFLLDQLGRPVFPEFVQIREEPHLLMGLGSAPYDGEGVRTTPHAIVQDGVLESYVLSSYSARKLGLASTGNAGGIHNLIIDPGHKNQAELIREMGTGLLLTEVMGQGVNLLTGDYSRGAAGFWVEDGEIQFPVEELTIAGNLKQLLASIVAVGNDVDLRGNTRTGSILIEEMTLAGH